jgi:hypothetical protein
MAHKITEEQAEILHGKYNDIKSYLEEISGKKQDLVIVCHEDHDKSHPCEGATILSEMELIDQIGLLGLAIRTVEVQYLTEQHEKTVPAGATVN